MKIVLVLALAVFGVVSAEPHQDKEINLLDIGEDDLDFDMDSMTVDEAREHMKLLRTVYNLLEQMEGEQGSLRRRFLGSFFKKMKHSVVKAMKKVGHFFKKTYHKAKSAFEKVVHKIHFKTVLHKMIPFIHSGMTVTACTAACDGAASAVLGPAAPVATIVCGPVCNGSVHAGTRNWLSLNPFGQSPVTSDGLTLGTCYGLALVY